ncbi:ankyrin repeat domain-containing protein [Zavarzinia compransoris]|uniref:Uncharacterized protein n=1 Tax=Zavarzinia compransoris TaxID=1264899 RepID=A0A317E4S2_9PROT|nr:ankyrin repeat domain-containing protein [Zavarzinia compransoris]PWR22128.1 hypothetical protein DKG75_09150 [Zavarzinia compransoris]TDP47123.1 ankyrin repeat protein [Zavarzinia compransoris]
MADVLLYLDLAARQRDLARARREAVEAARPGTTEALLAAAFHGRTGEVRDLLQAGLAPASEIDHVVAAAARGNRATLLRDLIAHQAPAPALLAEAWGQAAAAGALACLRVFETLKCDPEVADAFGWTPLFHAAAAGQAEAADGLIEAGAAIGRRDRQGRTPADWAAARGHHDMVERLIPADLPADLDALSTSDLNGLFVDGAQEGRPGRFRPLVAAGLDLAALGPVALRLAALHGRAEAVRQLLLLEVPPDAGNAMAVAAGRGRAEVVELLGAWGGRAEGMDPDQPGWPLVERARAGQDLIKACFWGRRDGVDAVLARGAPVNAREARAGQGGARGQRVYEDSVSVLMKAVFFGHAEAVARLLEEPALEIEAQFRYRTALGEAVWWGKDEIAMMLVRAGADANRPCRVSGETPLDMAGARDNPALSGRLRRLLRDGA